MAAVAGPLFRTVKEALRRRADRADVKTVQQADLDLFRAWYNHLRSHQGIAGLTPAEAWHWR